MEVPGLACHQPKLLPKVGRYELLLSCDLYAVRESDLVFSFIALGGTGTSATKSSRDNLPPNIIVYERKRDRQIYCNQSKRTQYGVPHG